MLSLTVDEIVEMLDSWDHLFANPDDVPDADDITGYVEHIRAGGFDVGHDYEFSFSARSAVHSSSGADTTGTTAKAKITDADLDRAMATFFTYGEGDENRVDEWTRKPKQAMKAALESVFINEREEQ